METQKRHQRRRHVLQHFLAMLVTIGRIIAPDFDGTNL
jgi:hypothetical protein